MKSVKFFLIGLCSLVSFCHSPPKNSVARFFYDLGGVVTGQSTAEAEELAEELVDKRNELIEKEIKLIEKDQKIAEEDLISKSFSDRNNYMISAVEKMLAEIKEHHKRFDGPSSTDSDRTEQGVTPSASAKTSPEVKPVTISCPNCAYCIVLPKSSV